MELRFAGAATLRSIRPRGSGRYDASAVAPCNEHDDIQRLRFQPSEDGRSTAPAVGSTEPVGLWSCGWTRLVYLPAAVRGRDAGDPRHALHELRHVAVAPITEIGHG